MEIMGSNPLAPTMVFRQSYAGQPDHQIEPFESRTVDEIASALINPEVEGIEIDGSSIFMDEFQVRGEEIRFISSGDNAVSGWLKKTDHLKGAVIWFPNGESRDKRVSVEKDGKWEPVVIYVKDVER